MLQACFGRNCDQIYLGDLLSGSPKLACGVTMLPYRPGVQDGLALPRQAQKVEGNTSAFSHNLARYRSPLQCCQNDSTVTVTATGRAEWAGEHLCQCPNLHFHWMLTALSAGQPRNGIFSRQIRSHTSLQKCTDQTNACQNKASISLKATDSWIKEVIYQINYTLR